jgi:hypothetical protein
LKVGIHVIRHQNSSSDMHWVRFAKCADRDSMWLRFVNSGIGQVSGWLRFAQAKNRDLAELASFGAYPTSHLRPIRPQTPFKDRAWLNPAPVGGPNWVRSAHFLGSDSRHSGIVFNVLDPNTAVGRLMFEKVTLRNIRGITHPYHRRKVDGNLHLFASIPGAHQGRHSKQVRSEVGFVDHR